MSTADLFKTFNTLAKKRGWSCQCDPSLAFAHQKLSAVAELWRAKSVDGAIPARAAFDARTLKPFLANMTLLERVMKNGSGRYRLRLHGTALSSYAGDHTGKFLEDVIRPDLLDGYNNVYDLVLRETRPLRVLWDYQVPAVSYLKGESFVAPLTAKDGAVNLLLSVTYAEAKHRVLAPAL